MEEIWKPIKDYEGLYEVSNLGRVKSIKNNLILKLSNNRTGYKRVQLYKDKDSKRIFVHRLVADAFIPNPDNKPCVDHINTVKDDNRVENLKWCTRKENQNNPLSLYHLSCSLTGKHPTRETILKRAVSVIQMTLDGEIIKVWECINDAARQLGLNDGNIQLCLKGKRNQTGGYKWKYKL